MITPHKLLDLEYSLLNVAGKIISILKQTRAIGYDELYAIVTRNGEVERAKYVFPLSLGFLFLVGKLNYDQNGDVIELTGYEA